MLVELSVAISVGEFAGELISHSLATDSSLFSMLTSLDELSVTNYNAILHNWEQVKIKKYILDYN